MTRYVVEVESIIGPVTLVTSGETFKDAWDDLKKEVPGVEQLIKIKYQMKIKSSKKG